MNNNCVEKQMGSMTDICW